MSQSTRLPSTARTQGAAALERLRAAFTLAPTPPTNPGEARTPVRYGGPGRPATEIIADAAARIVRIATIDLDREPWWLYFRRRK